MVFLCLFVLPLVGEASTKTDERESNESLSPALKREPIQAVIQIPVPVKKPKPRKWTFNASAGVSWVSNPLGITRVAAFRRRPKDSAWRFSNAVGGSYEVFKKDSWSGRLTYNYSEGFYSDSLSQLNIFSNSWGALVAFQKLIKGRPFVAQLGHTTSLVLRREGYFSTGFFQSGVLIYSLKDWHRVVFSERWGFETFASEGGSPDHTSRDGFSNDAGVINYFYFTQKKNFYTLFGFEYGKDHTQGVNFRADQFSYQAGLHFPLLIRLEGDLGFGLTDTQYPKWGFPRGTPGRRDLDYILNARLSRRLTKHWIANAYYSYRNNNSRDDRFTHTNHALGLSLSYSY